MAKKIKLISCVVLCLVMSIFLLSSASALGISPAKKIIRFTPNAPQSFTYQIINNEHKAMNLTIYAIGELANFTSIKTPDIKVSKEEETKDFEFTITPPADLQPGERIGKIVVEEFIPELKIGETRVYAKLKVISKIYIDVPYPEKYIDIDIDINDTEVGKPLDIIATITNLGTRDISSVQATFGVYEEEKKINESVTESESLARGDTKKLFASVDTTSFKPGAYSAIATVNYDNYILELGRDFKVGDVYIEILDYTKYFLIETVNRFDIDVENQWNKKIRNAYATIKIDNETKKVADLRSVAYDIDPREKKIVTSYWDTKEVGLGDYNANMTILYINKSTTKLGKVHVVNVEEYEKHLEKPLLKIIILIIIASVITALNFWFALRRRRGKKKRR